METRTPQPRYKGHNPSCQFVGYYKQADIYLCVADFIVDRMHTYSFQYSDKPGDYTTGTLDLLAHLHELHFPEEVSS